MARAILITSTGCEHCERIKLLWVYGGIIHCECYPARWGVDQIIPRTWICPAAPGYTGLVITR